jgi:hypothetical protein
MLVLIDKHRLSRLDESTGIGTYRRPRRGVIAVEHRPAKPLRQLTEQGTLPHGPRPVEHEHRLLGESRRRDLNQATLRQAGQNLSHDRILPVVFPDSGVFLPRLRTFSSRFPAAEFRKSGPHRGLVYLT